jgi:hydroxyacylglutathione hydrolase
MITVKVFTVNMVRENCYVVSDETGSAVIIDCGAYYEHEKADIRKYIDENGLHPQHSLCTHGHFDHIFGEGFVYETYGLKPEISSADARLYNHCEEQMLQFLGIAGNSDLPQIGVFLDERSAIDFGNHTLTVIPTPGHTAGGVSFYCSQEKMLFSGDSLFRQSVGRTDFPGGNEETLLSAIEQKILTLPPEVAVLPGHGPATSVGYEKLNNPFFKTTY